MNPPWSALGTAYAPQASTVAASCMGRIDGATPSACAQSGSVTTFATRAVICAPRGDLRPGGITGQHEAIRTGMQAFAVGNQAAERRVHLLHRRRVNCLRQQRATERDSGEALCREDLRVTGHVAAMPGNPAPPCTHTMVGRLPSWLRPGSGRTRPAVRTGLHRDSGCPRPSPHRPARAPPTHAQWQRLRDQTNTGSVPRAARDSRTTPPRPP